MGMLSRLFTWKSPKSDKEFIIRIENYTYTIRNCRDNYEAILKLLCVLVLDADLEDVTLKVDKYVVYEKPYTPDLPYAVYRGLLFAEMSKLNQMQFNWWCMQALRYAKKNQMRIDKYISYEQYAEPNKS